MRLEASVLHNLSDDREVPLADFPRDLPVAAVAGIGNPARFFNQLRDSGFTVVEHAFPDHHPYSGDDLRFPPDTAVIMTEKDAVKCRQFAQLNHWYLPVTARLDARFNEFIFELLKEKQRGQETA
jgi:tetraacyldisaccharide 4'-kinase